MLTTNDRFVQANDPNATGVALACATSTDAALDVVTAPAYLALATIPSTPARVWSDFGRKAMTKVDFHERWPLHSTS